MKKNLLLFSVAALMLASCGGPIKTGPQYTLNITKATDITDIDTAKMPAFSSVSIQGDYLTLKEGAIEYDYRIQKDKSFEAVMYNTSAYYSFFIYVEKYSADAPNLKYVRINEFMDEYMTRQEHNTDYVAVITANDDFYPYDIKGKIDLPRQFFPIHDETDLPLLKAENVDYFWYQDETDTAKVPDLIKAVTEFTIKDSTFTIGFGGQKYALPIYPCSDQETLGSKYYVYSFYTKPANGLPNLYVSMWKNKDGDLQVFVDDKDNDLELGGFIVAQDDFKSWDNLGRKICVCYPADEEYNDWLKELSNNN